MRVYSDTLNSFTQKAMKMAREIINSETEFSIARNRFIYKGYYHPLSIVIFEGEKIGYFDRLTYQIGLNRQLATEAKDDVLKNILRHEIAHYLCFIKYPNHTIAHGSEYKQVCSDYSWNHTAKASMSLEIENETVNALASEGVLRKVKKLMNLASSSNAHEAQLATLKANTLLIKHNLSRASISEAFIYTDTIHEQKQMNAKLSSIYEILTHFMLCPMLVNSKARVTLEASGNKETIELAHYLFKILDLEFERLWKQEKENHSLKGLKAKNSFFSGIARGYNQKMNDLTQSFTPSESTALMTVNNNIEIMRAKLYPKLRSSYSSRSIDTNSYDLGKKVGSKLNIKKGLKNTGKIFRIGN